MNRCGILKLLVPREQSPTPKNGIQGTSMIQLPLDFTDLSHATPPHEPSSPHEGLSAHHFLHRVHLTFSSLFTVHHLSPISARSKQSRSLSNAIVSLKPSPIFYGMHSLCISSKACIKFYSVFYLCTCLQLHRLQQEANVGLKSD